MPTSVVAILCVCGIAIGQILFKCAAESLKITGSYWQPVTASWLISALMLYGITTFGWIHTLQRGNLADLYPWMALAFILVPLLSAVFLGEKLSLSYWFGAAMIVAGVTIAIRS